MNEHRFTPGPWRVRERTEVYAAGYFVGTTRGNHPEPESIMIQDEANARLIAAAPELLARCIATERLLDPMVSNPASEDFMRELRAAINKATNG